MFTGIIEEVGVVKKIMGGNNNSRLHIQAKRVLEGTRIGDSIAVDGICLTVTELTGDGFWTDVMAETLRRSGLGQKRMGDQVNLERAMAADGRFGGHMVSGHIDGVGKIRKRQKEGHAEWVTIETTQTILQLIVEKGSICIDGISLTVAKLFEDAFAVSIIPHTGAETTLLHKKVGEIVNLENDMFGKYVRHFLMFERVGNKECDRKAVKTRQHTENQRPKAEQSGITMELLREYDI